MNRLELVGFRVTPKQQTADEVSHWLQSRHNKLQRAILDEDLLPAEKAALTLIESELTAFEELVAEELHLLDTRIAVLLKNIADAKRTAA